MRVDLHNHTTACNHAEGEMESYILKAIESQTEYFGFSDHAPMDFDEKYRMSFKHMKKYERDVLALKKKYSSQIKILLGYEVDYLEGHMDARVLDADVDYLIGSVHFLEEWGFDNPEFIGVYESQNIDAIWQKYFDTIEKMAQTGHFDIVGHIDLIKVFKFLPSKPVLFFAQKALQAVKKADMTLELNGAGYRKPIGEAYPSKEILQEAYNLNIPITFGSDAHKPEQVGMFNDEIIALAKSVGYKECAVYEKRKRKMVAF